jgi:FkbM family methyltransferase
MFINRLVRNTFNWLGADIRRLHESPLHTLLGLKAFPIQTVLDIGANEGQFAAYIRRFFPSALICSFEPLPGPFEKLSLAASRDPRLRPYNLALGEENGVVEFFLHSEHSPSSSFLQTTETSHKFFPVTAEQQVVSIRAATLDAWFQEHGAGIEKDILVKLDVQGFEDRVIRGGPTVLSEATACIVEVCIDRLYAGQAEFFEVSRLLQERGLRYVGNLNQAYAADGHVMYLDAVFVRP